MKLDAYLERYANSPDYLPLVELNSVLEFKLNNDAYEAERQLQMMQDHDGYPGVDFQRSGRVFNVHFASIARDGHLDYLDRLMTILGLLEPIVRPTLR